MITDPFTDRLGDAQATLVDPASPAQKARRRGRFEVGAGQSGDGALQPVQQLSGQLRRAGVVSERLS
jgi:hypothetical protein